MKNPIGNFNAIKIFHSIVIIKMNVNAVKVSVKSCLNRLWYPLNTAIF